MDSTTVITNVRVFDGDAVRPPLTVAVRDGLITDDTDQPGAATVDARGGVLLPGLIDAHVHIDSRADLDRCARAGVTTVLDMATHDIGALDALRDIAGLPTVRRAGMPASAPGGAHTMKMGFASPSAVADEHDATRFVADRVTDGVDYIKVIVEDPRMPGTAALPAATIRNVTHIAAHTMNRRIPHLPRISSGPHLFTLAREPAPASNARILVEPRPAPQSFRCAIQPKPWTQRVVILSAAKDLSSTGAAPCTQRRREILCRCTPQDDGIVAAPAIDDSPLSVEDSLSPIHAKKEVHDARSHIL